MTGGELLQEHKKFIVWAFEYAVDAVFISVVRWQEQGPPGWEFGVRSERGSDLEHQARACMASVRHRLAAYTGNPLVVSETASGIHRLRYSGAWIDRFGMIWAPLDDPRDTRGLNVNWVPDVRRNYDVAVRHGVEGWVRGL